MGGGNFVTQNKVRPGVYVNVVGAGSPVGAIGDRGVMAMALSLSWGQSKQVLTINAGDDVSVLLGYNITDVQLLLVKEALKRARTVLLYRLNTGTKALIATGNLTATAKHGGLRGNALSIVISVNIDDAAKFDVKTLLSGVVMDTQIVANIAGLVENNWVVFSGAGALATTAGAPLATGTDGAVINTDHTDFMAAIELQEFNAMAYTGTDATLKALYVAFVKRLRDAEGKKIQVVMENYPAADYEGVISVKNGVILSDGTIFTAAQATAWVAAATAGAQSNTSLTYDAYDDAVDVGTRYTNAQIEAALLAGEFVFTPSNGKAKVEQDISSFTSFTPTKPKSFRKNRVIRVLDGINNDFKRIFELYYLGKVDNNADGRTLLKSQCNTLLGSLQNINALQNFDAQTDVTIIEGTESDSVYIEVGVQPVDSIEKIYMKVTVR
jgi:hypothetical protein